MLTLKNLPKLQQVLSTRRQLLDGPTLTSLNQFSWTVIDSTWQNIVYSSEDQVLQYFGGVWHAWMGQNFPVCYLYIIHFRIIYNLWNSVHWWYQNKILQNSVYCDNLQELYNMLMRIPQLNSVYF